MSVATLLLVNITHKNKHEDYFICASERDSNSPRKLYFFLSAIVTVETIIFASHIL